ncbi:MAG: CvpA family protein [Alphaproteobacteria bacterium]|nr:CvpA family protein [Alphaproteobacteria bacterium]
MEQTDLILAVLTGLSVLIGLSRGFCSEVLNLAVYVFSGVLGYALVPVFRPVFAFIPYEPVQQAAAGLLGMFVAWFVLKVFTGSLIGAVKKSSLNKLDRSLGGIFGAVRAGVCIVLFYVALFFCSPDLIGKSRILTLSSGWIKKIPELDFQKEKTVLSSDEMKTAEAKDWKKRVLFYLQNKTVKTEDGEKKLISVLSSRAAKEFSGVLLEQGDEDVPLSSMQKRQLAEDAFEMQLTAWLNGETLDKEEAEKRLRLKMLEMVKEKSSKNEDSGD